MSKTPTSSNPPTTNKFKKWVNNRTDNVARRIKNTKTARNIKGFKDAQGFKNKAKYVGKGIGNKWNKIKNKSQTLQRISRAIKKTIKFITRFGKPIAIVGGIIILLFNGGIFIYSISQTIGTSPHYYCDIEPDPGTKESHLYQQYCAESSSIMKFEDLQGHYIIQDGSGPCTSAAWLNLALRYYTKQGINFYDYLWDDTGQIQNTVKYNGEEDIITRICMKGTSGPQKNYSNSGNPNGARGFAATHGLPGWTYAAMGYNRNDVTYDEDEAYEDLSTSEDWIFDLTQDGHSYSAYIIKTGVLEVEGVEATFRCVDSTLGRAELIDLLRDHPCGVYIYGKYKSGDDNCHAILITGYDAEKDDFLIVDSSKNISGGFEGYMSETENFNWHSCNTLMDTPDGSKVMSYMYIEEDTP